MKLNIKHLGKATKVIEKFVGKNQLPLLAGSAIIGLVTTGVAAYKMGLKAEPILKQRKDDISKLNKKSKKYEQRKKEINKKAVKEIAKIAVPTSVSGVATGACIIGLLSRSNKKIAVLSAAYTASEKALNDINKKLKAELGEKKTKAIKDAIIKDNIGDVPKDKDGKDIIVCNEGEILCKDMYTGHIFKTTADKVRRAINEISADCMNQMYVSLNDFYGYMEQEHMPVGNDIGWNVDDLNGGRLPIELTTVLMGDKPCLAIDYTIRVRDSFRNFG